MVKQLASLMEDSFTQRNIVSLDGNGTDDYPSDLSVALVHDWLPLYAGAERVLEQMISIFEHSSLYSLIDFVPQAQRDFLKGKEVQTSFIQHLPFAQTKYRYYFPLAPLAIEQFNLREHDIVLSSSYAVAKGVLTHADQLHISYVHSPVRYAWDLHFQYLRQRGWERGVRGMLARMILHYIRLFDAVSADRVDVFIANSEHVARRIWKTYRRKAEVIYPPVDTEAFSLYEQKEDFYVTMSRLVEYKRVDLIVKAFSEMPERQLIVIGEGPEFDKLRKLAGANVTLLGYQPEETVQYYMERAQAFVFAAEEDFGIVPVEAQACGTPVIAYGRGGVLETTVPGETGIFFKKQEVSSLKAAVDHFEKRRADFVPELVHQHAQKFSKARFRTELASFVERSYNNFFKEGLIPAHQV